MAPALRHTAGGPISLMPPVSKVLLRAVSYVPNWKMAGTKHCALVSYECRSSPRIFKARHFVRARYLARNAPRYRFQASLEIEWGSARLKARTRDISAGGMFIESEDVLWVGAGFRARLAVERAKEQALWLDCSVKRVEPGHGMGVAIALPPNQSQQNFEDLLAKLAIQP